MLETELQTNILDLATKLGYEHYHTYRSNRSDKGFVDLVLISAEKERLLFIELKSKKGVITPEQTMWHDLLAACDQEIYVVRPQHWDSGEVVEILTMPHKPSKRQRLDFDSAVVKI